MWLYIKALTFNSKLGYSRFNPLSPHDALKHHLTALKTDLSFQQQRVLE